MAKHDPLDNWYTAIIAAKDRIHKYIHHTPLQYSLDLSQIAGANGTNVYLKLESEQPTGSFKVIYIMILIKLI